jgi:hypothetical protein
VKVKIACSEGVEPAVCFMTVVLFPVDMEFSLSSQRPDWLWDASSPLFGGNPGSSFGNHITGDRSWQLTSNTGDKNEWSFASTT